MHQVSKVNNNSDVVTRCDAIKRTINRKLKFAKAKKKVL